MKGGLLVKALAGLFGPPPCYHTFKFIAYCTKSSKGNKLYLYLWMIRGNTALQQEGTCNVCFVPTYCTFCDTVFPYLIILCPSHAAAYKTRTKRVQNAPDLPCTNVYFAKHLVDWKERYHILFEDTLLSNFCQLGGILSRRYATINPCGVGWGRFCAQNRIKIASKIACVNGP